MIRYSLFILVLSLLSFPLRAAQLTSSEVLPELNHLEKKEFFRAVKQCNSLELESEKKRKALGEIESFTTRFDIDPFKLSNEDGNTLFSILEDPKVAKILIDAFIKKYEYDNLNRSDIEGNTILHHILLGCFDINLKEELVESLPENFDVNKVNNYGKTPLHVVLAIPSMSDSQKELLVSSWIRENDQSVGVPGDVSRIILAFYSSEVSDGKLRIFIALGNRGANPNQVNTYGTPQYCAAYNGDTELLRGLVETLKADPMQGKKGPEPSDQEAPLHAAVEGRHFETVKYLIEEAGVDRDQKNDRGKTAVCLAASEGYQEILEYLVGAGANLDLEDNSGFKPSHIAAMGGREGILKYLVEEAGVNPDQKVSKGSCEGMLPLHIAASMGQTEACRYLIAEAGVDVDQKDHKEGRTAACFAAFKGHKRTLKYLVGAGANLDLEDKSGLKPIHIAVINGHKNILKYLVESSKVDWKKEVSKGPRQGMSLLDLAASSSARGRLDVFQYLVKELGMPVDEAVEKEARKDNLLRYCLEEKKAKE